VELELYHLAGRATLISFIDKSDLSKEMVLKFWKHTPLQVELSVVALTISFENKVSISVGKG